MMTIYYFFKLISKGIKNGDASTFKNIFKKRLVFYGYGPIGNWKIAPHKDNRHWTLIKRSFIY